MSEILNVPTDKNKYLILSTKSVDVVIPIQNTENGYSYMITYNDLFKPEDVDNIKIIYNNENLILNNELKNSKIIACGVF